MAKSVQMLSVAVLLGSFCFGAVSSSAQAGEQGNAAEAHAMLERAAAHFQKVGKDQALADFTSGAEGFKDRDLYVYCIDKNEVWTAHGANKVMIGRDVSKVKDVDGNSVGDAIVAAVNGHEEGSVDYKWPNPLTKKTELKTTFLRSMGDNICAVGYYH